MPKRPPPPGVRSKQMIRMDHGKKFISVWTLNLEGWCMRGLEVLDSDLQWLNVTLPGRGVVFWIKTYGR
jgi:hypothetical protein